MCAAQVRRTSKEGEADGRSREGRRSREDANGTDRRASGMGTAGLAVHATEKFKELVSTRKVDADVLIREWMEHWGEWVPTIHIDQ
jgi:hypothetical protein